MYYGSSRSKKGKKMNNRVEALMKKVAEVGVVKENFDLAGWVLPDTLRKTNPLADIWHVSSNDGYAQIREVLKKRDDVPAAVEKLAEYILQRFDSAAAAGIATLVVDEPSMFMADILMSDLAKHLRGEGFDVSNKRESKHRHCDHANGKGRACHYDGDLDGGSGDINGLQLMISLPLLAKAA
jgi:hypothetical protein